MKQQCDDMGSRKVEVTTEVCYEEMDRKEFDRWLSSVTNKLLWFDYVKLLDIAAKFTSVHGRQCEYPRALGEALSISRQIEIAKHEKEQQAKEKSKPFSFAAPPNLRDEECQEEAISN